MKRATLSSGPRAVGRVGPCPAYMDPKCFTPSASLHCPYRESNDVGPTGLGITTSRQTTFFRRRIPYCLALTIYMDPLTTLEHPSSLTREHPLDCSFKPRAATTHTRKRKRCLHSLYSPRNRTWICRPMIPSHLPPPHDIPPAIPSVPA